MNQLPPEILDVLDRVDWSEMRADNRFIRSRSMCCPLEVAFDLPRGHWSEAPVDADTSMAIMDAADGHNFAYGPAIRSEMLRRIQAKTPRVIK